MAIIEKAGVGSVATAYSVKNFVDCFDTDMAEATIRNYDRFSEDDRMILEAIFLDETARVRMCSGFYKDNHGVINSLRCGEYDLYFPYETEDALPNPNTYNFVSLGGFERDLWKASRNNDTSKILQIMDVFSRCINFGDSVVLEVFVDYLYKYKCIMLPDGRMTDAYEAIKVLA